MQNIYLKYRIENVKKPCGHKKKKDSTELEIAEKAIRKIVRDKNHEDFRKIKELIKSLEFSSRLITENTEIQF